MIQHVFKYPLPLTDDLIEIKLPANYRFCDIQTQDDNIVMWCMVDMHAPLITKKFKVYGTGHKIDNAENHRFLKTVQFKKLSLVFHVFEVLD